MFSDEIKEKIRNYTPPPVSKQEKQKQLKQHKKMEMRIEKDSQYLWNKLQELYEENIPYFAKRHQLSKIEFMISTNPAWDLMSIFGFYRVYYSIDMFEHILLSRRKIKYPMETLKRLSDIALDNGFDVYFDEFITYYHYQQRYRFIPSEHSFPGRKGKFHPYLI